MTSRFVKDLLTVPNIMSLSRLVAAPALIILWIGLEWRVTCLVLGTILGVTDGLDGYVARKLNQTTEIGALIDQLGDLVFESICILMAVLVGYLWSGWLVVYLFREFTVVVIRSYVTGHGGTLPSTMLGKVKSSCIQWALFGMFLGGIIIQPGVIPAEWRMLGVSPGQMIIWIAAGWIIAGIGIGMIGAAKYFRAFVDFYSHTQEG